MSKYNRYMFISDLQIPFEATHALKFCKAVQREFKIDSDAIYNVGDEVDLYHGSMHRKDPDFTVTPNDELRIAQKKLKEWYTAFPKMKLAISNHGLRYQRKACEAEIPSQVLKPYQEILKTPPTWVWKDRWLIRAPKQEIMMIHGLGYAGINAQRQSAIDLGYSVVHGHLHSNAGISHIRTQGRDRFGMNVGCLVDIESFAFKYGKDNKYKPVLSIGVVVDGGLTPILLPYERIL